MLCCPHVHSMPAIREEETMKSPHKRHSSDYTFTHSATKSPISLLNFSGSS